MEYPLGGRPGERFLGLAEQRGDILGLFLLDGPLQSLDDVLDPGLHGTVPNAPLLGLAGGLQCIFMDDRHVVCFSGEKSLFRYHGQRDKVKEL